jgi:hypothetical protein
MNRRADHGAARQLDFQHLIRIRTEGATVSSHERTHAPHEFRENETALPALMVMALRCRLQVPSTALGPET